MADENDLELVLQCLNGDNGAFDHLVMRYQLPMYRTALGIVKDKYAAKDIIQNGFIKSWEKLHTFNTGKKFYSWLYKIMINESLNYLRNTRKGEMLSPSLQDDHTPFQIMVAKEESRQLYDSMALLSKDQRIVIQLRHFEELSYQEIADILEIDEKKVKSRLFSARMKLRELLSEA